jgi:hypothetical protein
MWKNIVARQATDDNIGHAHYKHTVEICNTYCFSTSATVARTLLNVPLHVRILFAVICSPPQSPVLSDMDLVYTVISCFFKICSSVGVVTRPRTGRPRGRGSFRDRYKIYLSSVQRPDRRWGPISLLCTWYRRPFFREYSSLEVKLTTHSLVTRLKVCGGFFNLCSPSLKTSWHGV